MDGVDAAYLDEDERSDSEVVSKGFPRHESANGRDIPVRRRNIENLICEVMKEMNCSSIVTDIEISAMSKEVITELENKVNEKGLQIEELFINDTNDPHHNLGVKYKSYINEL